MRVLLIAITLALTACATTITAPAGARTWRGPEGEVVTAILSAENSPSVVTFLFDNGNHFVATDLRLNEMQPDSYCFRGLAENHPRATQGRWRAYDPEGDGRGCMVFRGVVTAWEGDARTWR